MQRPELGAGFYGSEGEGSEDDSGQLKCPCGIDPEVH